MTTKLIYPPACDTGSKLLRTAIISDPRTGEVRFSHQDGVLARAKYVIITLKTELTESVMLDLSTCICSIIIVQGDGLNLCVNFGPDGNLFHRHMKIYLQNVILHGDYISMDPNGILIMNSVITHTPLKNIHGTIIRYNTPLIIHPIDENVYDCGSHHFSQVLFLPKWIGSRPVLVSEFQSIISLIARLEMHPYDGEIQIPGRHSVYERNDTILIIQREEILRVNSFNVTVCIIIAMDDGKIELLTDEDGFGTVHILGDFHTLRLGCEVPNLHIHGKVKRIKGKKKYSKMISLHDAWYGPEFSLCRTGKSVIKQFERFRNTIEI